MVLESRKANELRFYDELYARQPSTAFNGYFEISSGARHFHAQLSAAAPNRNILEFGCGDGAYATFLARQGAARVTGIDISPAAIQRAAERLPADLRDVVALRVADAESLDFADASFDVVCGAGIIHHLDTERATSEIHRVLRPGGRAIFYEPLGYNPLLNLYRAVTPHSHTPDEHPLKKADFKILRRFFPEARIDFFDLLGLATIPLLGSRAGQVAQRVLEGADRLLFRTIPPSRLWATMAVIDARKA